MQTNRYTEYILVKKKKERETTSAETKACQTQLTQTEHSQTQILELKRNTTLSKHLPL